MYSKEGIREVVLSGIRCLLAEPEKSNGSTLLFYHGWGSVPENQVFLAKILSSCGFTVLLPEMIHHGSRDPFENPFDEKVMKNQFWKTVLHSVEEADSLLSEVINCGLASKGRIGVIGSSTGGIVASGIFARDTAIDSLVTINGSPAWEETDSLWRKADGRPPATDEEILPLRKYDLMNHWDKVKERPVLMLHGSDDETLSPLGAKKFLEEAKKHRITSVRYSEYRNVNHTISLNMVEEMVNWLMEKTKKTIMTP